MLHRKSHGRRTVSVGVAVVTGIHQDDEKYQRETAGEDHEDDERLEVLVVDQPVHGTAEAPPRSSSERPVQPLAAAAGVTGAALGTALVWVLHEYDLHLYTNPAPSAALHKPERRGRNYFLPSVL